MDYLTLSFTSDTSSFKISNISTTATPDREDHLPDQHGNFLLLPLLINRIMSILVATTIMQPITKVFLWMVILTTTTL
jgi:hypothetical protein